MPTKITIEEFDAYVAALASHDWYYDYSDDHRVWRKGKDASTALGKTASEHDFFMRAYKAWCQYLRSDIEKRAVATVIRDDMLADIRIEVLSQ